MPDVPDGGGTVVYGSRVSGDEFAGGGAAFGGAYANLVPSWWVGADPNAGIGGLETINTTELLANANIVIKPAGMKFPVLIRGSEWDKMPKNLQVSIEMTLRHSNLSSEFKDALAHIDAADGRVEIRVDAVSHLPNGSTREFSIN